MYVHNWDTCDLRCIFVSAAVKKYHDVNGRKLEVKKAISKDSEGGRGGRGGRGGKHVISSVAVTIC